MDNASPSPIRPERAAAEPPGREPVADPAMAEYVGYFASWFDIARLAAGRRLDRSGVRSPLLTDS